MGELEAPACKRRGVKNGSWRGKSILGLTTNSSRLLSEESVIWWAQEPCVDTRRVWVEFVMAVSQQQPGAQTPPDMPRVREKEALGDVRKGPREREWMGEVDVQEAFASAGDESLFVVVGEVAEGEEGGVEEFPAAAREAEGVCWGDESEG